MGTVAVFGGAGKWEMARELKKAGSDVVVATPGRMMEFIQEQVVDLQERCTFLVVDEADRMFELGFQDQLTSLAQRIRPSRQAIFTTATLPPKVDGLVRVRSVQGAPRARRRRRLRVFIISGRHGERLAEDTRPPKPGRAPPVAALRAAFVDPEGPRRRVLWKTDGV